MAILTVRDVQALPAMAGATLLAGSRGLDRAVTSATVLDAPDGALWLKANELAFTSTYPLINLPDGLEPFVADLAARGISGLGVKLTRYMTEIPRPVLDIADQLGFPIISLHEQVSWIELINPIITNVIVARADRHRRSEAILGGFAESLIVSSGLADLARLMAEMVENPVLIDCEAHGLTAWSEELGQDQEAALLALLRDDEIGATPVDPETGIYRRVGRVGTLVFTLLAPEIGVAGRVAVLERNRPFNSDDLDCLRHARMVSSIKVLHLIEELTARQARYRAVVATLIDPGISQSTREMALSEAAEVGRDWRPPFVVVCCRIDGIDARHQADAAAALQVGAAAEGIRLIGFPEQGRAVLIGDYAVASDRAALDRLIHSLGATLSRRFASASLRAGASSSLRAAGELANGYRQAEQALRFADEASDTCAVRFLEDVGLFQLFSSDAIRPEVGRFVDDWLGLLLAEDDGERLVPTLHAFLQANGNHREAAQRLNLHHNTVRYRMAKIRRLTGHDVMAPNVKLQYDIALALREMFGHQDFRRAPAAR